MEKIKINKLDQRGTMLIVGIEGKEDHTMQAGWQAQEVDYFMKDVGVGGSVSCTLYDKPDKNNASKIYHNIKDVDFSSAVKGEATSDHHNPDENGVYPTGNTQTAYTPKPTDGQYRTPKEISAQNLLAIEFRNSVQPKPLEILESYRFYLSEL